MQAHLGDIARSDPDHGHRAGLAIKRVEIFLLVEGLAVSL